jgi:hypothetical protein
MDFYCSVMTGPICGGAATTSELTRAVELHVDVHRYVQGMSMCCQCPPRRP